MHGCWEVGVGQVAESLSWWGLGVLRKGGGGVGGIEQPQIDNLEGVHITCVSSEQV